MEIIEATELKEMLDRGDDIKLVMTLGDLAFQGKHIPGSLNLHTSEALSEQLQPTDHIVVYCSDSLCPASMMAYHFLESQGYEYVRRFSGGLSAWEEAGYRLEGELVE